MCPQFLEQLDTLPVQVPPRRTILLVDDETAIVDVLKYRLEQQGYRTLEAHCGTDGLKLAKAECPDLIILDLRLPDMEGFTVGEELADFPATCHIPIIIVSAMERPDIIRRARAAGCHYYLRKPYDPNALLVLIEHALEQQQR
jgi:CheY-like chemotaxis protein